MIPFELIVAVDEELGIGKGGKLPWHLSADLKHFKKITTSCKDLNKSNAVIMGRKTWNSLPDKFKPLPGRINIVLTRNEKFELPQDVIKVKSLPELKELLQAEPYSSKIERAFVIGGAELFREAINLDLCERIYMTHISGKFQCDTFFPAFLERFQSVDTSNKMNEGPLTFCFKKYLRK